MRNDDDEQMGRIGELIATMKSHNEDIQNRIIEIYSVVDHYSPLIAKIETNYNNFSETFKKFERELKIMKNVAQNRFFEKIILCAGSALAASFFTIYLSK